MTAKVPKPGGEIDSWCTKCRLILNHRIVAVVATKPVKVECMTCRETHMYRAHPPGQKPAGGGSTTRSSGPREPRVSAVTKAELARAEREKSWEKAIAGKAYTDFRPYRVSEMFQEGDLVRHSKFGDGIVNRVIDAKKIEVLFKDEPRTLAQGMQL
ncbi:MAG: hypothetical protein U0169_14280 [Polyangiaceae bacterium]